MPLFRICLMVAAIVVLTGCSARPWWGPPGTIYQQRNNAVLHDPFPDNQAGPEIVGGRPMGFEQPWTEARNSQSSPYAR